MLIFERLLNTTKVSHTRYHLVFWCHFKSRLPSTSLEIQLFYLCSIFLCISINIKKVPQVALYREYKRLSCFFFKARKILLNTALTSKRCCQLVLSLLFLNLLYILKRSSLAFFFLHFFPADVQRWTDHNSLLFTSYTACSTSNRR